MAMNKFGLLGKGYLGLLRCMTPLIPRKCVKIMEQDWDFLIVLDACRFDVFQKLSRIRGRLSKKISVGSSTKEWCKKSFTDLYPSVVYFSANPHISKYVLKNLIGRQPFHEIIEIWDFGWDSTLKTVLPKEVNKTVLENMSKYYDKKMIIHYVQPHHPFLSHPELMESGLERWRDEAVGRKSVNTPNVWNLLRNGLISVEEVKKSYEENLKIVLAKVQDLIKKLSHKIVVTSDHGNCFGEWGIYGHPDGVHIKPLVEIPWLEIQKSGTAESDAGLSGHAHS